MFGLDNDMELPQPPPCEPERSAGSLERLVSRSAFEAWISSPPYERSTHRWPENGTKAWPGQYSDYSVELAWEAWQAAANAPAHRRRASDEQ